MDRSAYLEPLSRVFLKLYRVTKKLQSSGFEDQGNKNSQSDYSNFGIVISTFEDRFFTYALPLIRNIRTSTSSPITLIINGNLNKELNQAHYSEFLSEISQIPDIFPVTFQKFQGCAKMWNTGIIFSAPENLLILNDDITILPSDFISEISSALDLLKLHKVLTINMSWSHFLISHDAIKSIGWFDEKLLGIGNEDGDYDDRHVAKFGSKVKDLQLSSFVNISDNSRDESVAPTKSKYSLFNEIMHEEKSTLNPSINLYPLWEWSEQMKIHLVNSDSTEVREAVKIGLNQL